MTWQCRGAVLPSTPRLYEAPRLPTRQDPCRSIAKLRTIFPKVMFEQPARASCRWRVLEPIVIGLAADVVVGSGIQVLIREEIERDLRKLRSGGGEEKSSLDTRMNAVTRSRWNFPGHSAKFRSP